MNAPRTISPHPATVRPTDIETALRDMSRAIALYFAWRSTGLLDSREPPTASPPVAPEKPPENRDSG